MNGERLASVDDVLSLIAAKIHWDKVQSVAHGDRTEFLEEMRRLAGSIAVTGKPDGLITDVISEDWLKSVGFKWNQFDRQPTKQWLLWCGIRSAHNWGVDTQDIGVEISQGTDSWFCWLRSDAAHRYSRFLHVRHMQMRDEVVKLVEAVTGLPWKPENHIFGAVYTGEQAAHHRAEWGRIDRQMLLKNHPWREVEKDDTRGGALPEHMEVAEGFAKRRGEK
jgi:hypothetical protein